MKNIPRVRNLESPRTGNPVANQFVIEDGKREVFQSYKTVVAVVEDGKVTLDKRALDYSVTTSKYLYQFLVWAYPYRDVSRADVKRMIADGTYNVADLNGR